MAIRLNGKYLEKLSAYSIFCYNDIQFFAKHQAIAYAVAKNSQASQLPTSFFSPLFAAFGEPQFLFGRTFQSMRKTALTAHPWYRLALSILALLCLSGLLASCASKSKKDAQAEKFQLLWPEPPDQPRFSFEAVLRSPNDLKKETEEDRFRKMVTGGDAELKAFVKPSSVAARHGMIYVVDPPSNRVVVFDVPGRRVFRFGYRQPNQLERPLSVSTDETGKVYVLEERKRVMVFDDMGLFLFAISTPRVTKPVNVAVSKAGDRIYVVDRGSLDGDDHRVLAYGPDGRELFQIGLRGKNNGQFNIPLGLAVLPDGNLAVLDSGNFRVQIFTPDGQYVRHFGEVGNQLGQFGRPRSIAADSDGNIYVADGTFNNVQIFNPDGQLLLPLGHLRTTDGPGHFALISGIGVDETKRLYVLDNYFNKLEVFRRLPEPKPAV